MELRFLNGSNRHYAKSEKLGHTTTGPSKVQRLIVGIVWL